MNLSIILIIILFVTLIYYLKSQLYDFNTSNFVKSMIDKVETRNSVFNKTLLRADHLFDEKDYRKAEQFYLKALSLNDKNAHCFNRLGVIYNRHGHHQDALISFEHAVKLNPIANNYHNLGLTQLTLHSFHDAISSLSSALTEQKKPSIYLAIAKAHSSLGDLASQISVLETAITELPDSLSLHNALLEAYQAQSDTRQVAAIKAKIKKLKG
ncbi:tetratricopeptide repeat protein [Candidatus Nomurabacteria bacterium]|nr:tetratricopeptide repeat protein [Candidatus Nomurabacteria bacterium]